MGNLPLSTGLFGTSAAVSEQGRFIAKRIRIGITYYYTPISEPGEHTLSATTDFQTSTTLCPISSLSSSALPKSRSPSADPSSLATSRPLLVFFSWLGAPLAAVGKYRDLYMDRGMDFLLVQSNVMHFLWPQWGLEYGLEVLKVLEEPQFSGRPVLVHSCSIGGYTFTQTLTHISQGWNKHTDLAQRVIGHIYDSLVVGTLERMAIGLGRTLVPRLERFIKNLAMFYFWLFKRHTADFYNTGIQVFHNSPVTAPALFFYSENDPLCDHTDLEKVIDFWRKRGMTVRSRKWKVSKHAAHMRCHPEDYLCTLEKYLNSLDVPSIKAKM